MEGVDLLGGKIHHWVMLRIRSYVPHRWSKTTKPVPLVSRPGVLPMGPLYMIIDSYQTYLSVELVRYGVSKTSLITLHVPQSSHVIGCVVILTVRSVFCVH
jgi:hypothetical protein